MCSIDSICKNPHKINWKNDFFCGIHSGLPMCCVLFYCDVWYKKLSLDSDFIPISQILHDSERPIGYIMCPNCLAGHIEGTIKPVLVKNCNCWDDY